MGLRNIDSAPWFTDLHRVRKRIGPDLCRAVSFPVLRLIRNWLARHGIEVQLGARLRPLDHEKKIEGPGAMRFVELLLGLAEVGDDSVDVLLQAFGADEVATLLFVALILDSGRVECGCELALGLADEVFVQSA